MPKDYLIKGIDPGLQKDFKTACAHYGISMRATLIKHMQNIVNDYYKYKRGFTGPDSTQSKRGKR